MRALLGAVRCGPNGLSLSVPRGRSGGGGQRGEVKGWSRKSCARHVRWLHSVDGNALDGFGYAVTLTVRDLPTSEQWGKLRGRWLRWLRDRGVSRVHWVVEWQARGAPHVHAAIYFDAPLTPPERFEVLDAWVTAARALGTTMAGQDLKPLAGDGLGWAQYQAKHSARSVHHYQRGTMPPGWTTTGRLWGHSGDWAVTESRYVLTNQAFYDLRRLVRGYALASARSERDPGRRASRVRACRGILRGDSGLRGCREWVPAAVQERMLQWVASRPGGDVWSLDEFEELVAELVANPVDKSREAARVSLLASDRASSELDSTPADLAAVP